jgi:hypothetical protein
VVCGLEYLIRETSERNAPSQFPLLQAIVHYLKTFPEPLVGSSAGAAF